MDKFHRLGGFLYRAVSCMRRFHRSMIRLDGYASVIMIRLDGYASVIMIRLDGYASVIIFIVCLSPDAVILLPRMR